MKFRTTSCRTASSGALARQARLAGARSYGSHTAARLHQSIVNRDVAALASSRLFLTPIGSGSTDHIGEKVPLPAPIELKDGVYEVGRSTPADILLKIPTVSSRHALLRVEDTKVFATDLNSTNGTVVDGQELTPLDNVELGVGSEIIFGDHYLAKFQLTEVAEEMEGGPGTPDHQQQQQSPNQHQHQQPQPFGTMQQP